MTTDELYIQRTFDLADLGRGKVSPNPLVGCVIVKDGKVIGEGYHRKYGESHAEVNAINSVPDKEDLKGAILYVNLEPCAHHGNTPPCANLIIQYPFRKVVISNSDPNPLVQGKGIEIIRSAGIEVVKGVMEAQGLEFNRRFFTFMEKKRPYVILKWAETSDGFIAKEDYTSKWISNEFSRKIVHKWRAEEDAVMIGKNTASYDNPRLNVRDWSGEDPLRIVIDKNLQLPQTLDLFDPAKRTLCYNFIRQKQVDQLEYVKIDPSRKIVESILEDLYRRKVQSLIVEGGTQLFQSFIDLNAWDEIRAFKCEKEFKTGIKRPEFYGTLVTIDDMMGDRLSTYKRT
ncbi:MAG: bifunctional diaminohydroxyphosphoribosylaminopyrimidine deaminase/5-amino-6-(5-phosphoribosylamino)uracil reductase RibD [Cytophagaceae bacterium]